MVNTAALEHVGDELGRDGGTRLVLLVLPGIGKVRKLSRVESRQQYMECQPACAVSKKRPYLEGAGCFSCQRTTAVMRLALAILQAWHIMMVSISEAFVGVYEEDAVLRR